MRARQDDEQDNAETAVSARLSLRIPDTCISTTRQPYDERFLVDSS